MQYIKLELGCLLVMAYLAYQYLHAKRPKTTVNQACRSMLIVGVSNLICQLLAAGVANNLRIAPQWLTRFFYQLHFASLCLFLFCTAYYLLASIQSANLLISSNQTMLLGVLGCGVVLTFLLPLYMQGSAGGVYTRGPMTYINQFASFFYIATAGYHMFKHRDPANAKRFDVFLPVLPAVMLLSVLQFIFPSMTVSGISVILLSLAAVMTADNAADYYSFNQNVFNNKAFAQVADDWLLRDKKFSAVFVSLHDMSLLEETLGRDAFQSILSQLGDYVSTIFKLDMFVPIEGCAAILVDNTERIDTIVYGLEQRFENEWILSGVSLIVVANVIRLDMPDPYSNVEDIMKAAMEQSESAQRPVVLVDKKLGLKNKKAFDRELAVLHHERKNYTSIYYLIADVTGMHKINEVHGYIAGDKILQDCANILTEAAGEGVEVYRIGGDEFALLLMSRSDKEVRDLLERIQALREKCNKERGQIPLEIAVGYSRYYEDSDKSFNSMIARAEFQMNNLRKHMGQEVDLFSTTRLGTKLLKH